MSEDGKMKMALGEQDYVLPQVYFPSVVTIKDPTEAEFIYVLNNFCVQNVMGRKILAPEQ